MPFFKILLLALFLAIPFKSADARISIYPLKIVLDPRDRSAEVTILNMIDRPSLYRVSIIHYRQNTDGSYTAVSGPLDANFDPETAVRLSPRQFQLPAQGRQKIRLSLRKPADLPDGEYRFHLLAQRFETQDAGVSKGDKEVAIDMRMNVGVSIPVIIRHGKQLGANAKIANARYVALKPGSKAPHGLQVAVNRQGNISTIGNLSVFKGEERIAYVDNFNIFPEINERNITLDMTQDPRGQGNLRVVYMDDNDNILDETTISP